MLGFEQIAVLVDQRLPYRPNAREITGDGEAVHAFLNPDGTIWKVGMTRNGFNRVNYQRVIDGRVMKRPHVQRKLTRIRAELHDGATQRVTRTSDALRLEDLLSVILEPSESSRRVPRREAAIRSFAAGLLPTRTSLGSPRAGRLHPDPSNAGKSNQTKSQRRLGCGGRWVRQ